VPPVEKDKPREAGGALAALHDAVTGPRGFVVFLTAALAALCVVRMLFPNAPSNADAGEQLWMAVDWRWSYGSGANPPLFTWLVMLVDAVLGSTMVSVEVVRFALLWLFCVLSAHSVRAATGDARLGALAGLAPLAVYAIGWEALFRHSNTMLLLVAVAMTFAALQRLDRDGDARAYLYFALATAFGVYGKYNYIPVWAAFVAVALMDGRLRARLLDRRTIAALLFVLLLASPLLHWVAGHLNGMVGHGRMRLAERPTFPALPGRLSALADLAAHTAGLVVPLFLVLLPLCPRAFGRLAGGGNTDLLRWRRLIRRYLLIVFVVLAAAILALGTTRFQARYVYVLAPVLPLAFLRLAAAGFGGRLRQWLALALVAVILLVFVGAIFRGVTYKARHPAAAPPAAGAAGR
jgi:4-amino-4-deoxy-L-arabinose transferase-like glycosyltransferase